MSETSMLPFQSGTERDQKLVSDESVLLLQSLMKFVNETIGANFTIRCVGNCFDTRFRVCLWNKPEGERLSQPPGEGYGKTATQAIEMAIKNYNQRKTLDRKTSGHWYLPEQVIQKLSEAHE